MEATKNIDLPAFIINDLPNYGNSFTVHKITNTIKSKTFHN